MTTPVRYRPRILFWILFLKQCRDFKLPKKITSNLCNIILSYVHFMKLPYEQNFPELCKYRQLQCRACFRLFLNLSSGVYLHLEQRLY